MVEIAYANSPFERHLEHGSQLRAGSPAAPAFLIELAGGGSYALIRRSVARGGRGFLPASNPVGAKGGEILPEKTLKFTRGLGDDRAWSWPRDATQQVWNRRFERLPAEPTP